MAPRERTAVRINVRGSRLVSRRLQPARALPRPDPGAAGTPTGEAGPVPAVEVASRAPVVGSRGFRRAAVALAGSTAGTAEARRAAAGAADALVALAAAGNAAALRDLLRPDPASEAVAWSVACYQIGDLTPSALRDFSDPLDAVGTLSSCGQSSHLAAELIACAGDGLRWTAAVRTGDAVSFQLLAPSTSSGDHDGADIAGASQRWEDRLRLWAAMPDGSGDVDAAIAEPSQPRPPGGRAGPSPATVSLLADLVESIVARTVAAMQAGAGPSPEIVARLDRIDHSLDDIVGALDALHIGQPLGALTASVAVQVTQSPVDRAVAGGLRVMDPPAPSR